MKKFKEKMIEKIEKYFVKTSEGNRTVKASNYMNKAFFKTLTDRKEVIREQKVKSKQLQVFVETRNKEINTYKSRIVEMKNGHKDIQRTLENPNNSKELFHNITKGILLLMIIYMMCSVYSLK